MLKRSVNGRFHRIGNRFTAVKPMAITAAVVLAGGALWMSPTGVASNPPWIWSSETAPPTEPDVDRIPLELGVRFVPSVAGQVDAIRYYKLADTTPAGSVTLWNATGDVLARAELAPVGKDEVGWQVAELGTPVSVTADTTYVASYTSAGAYALQEDSLGDTQRVTTGNITALAGVYGYAQAYPEETWKDANYFVDVRFIPEVPRQEPTPTDPPSASFQANCIASPHTCGYPDATNTGVPAGTKLTRVPQEATSGPGWGWREDIRAVYPLDDGSVIRNLRIDDGMIIVNRRNVVIRDVSLTNSGLYPIDCNYHGEPSCQGLVVEDTEIAGLSADCLVGIAFQGYTARRVNIHGCQDGFKADANTLIEDSYVHDLAYSLDPSTGEDTHNDGVQTTGGSNVTLRHNTIRLSDIRANAVVQFGTEWGTPNTNWTIEDNLLDGGGWVFNANSPVKDSLIKGNRFTRNYGYGIGDVQGATWIDNYFDDDGAPVR